jgi:hypothetical protein
VNPEKPRTSNRAVRPSAPLLSCLLGAASAACSSGAAGPGAPLPQPQRAPDRVAPNTEAPWCAAVPELSADPSGDQTGRSNSRLRVEALQDAFAGRFLSCPGATGVGLTIAPFAEADVRREPLVWTGGPVSDSDPRWVIEASVTDAAHLPRTNPLYLQGVRVYFDVRNVVPE